MTFQVADRRRQTDKYHCDNTGQWGCNQHMNEQIISILKNPFDQPEGHFPDALEFLNTAGDDEVIWFLRRLPMFGGNDGGQITLKDLAYEMMLVPFVMSAWDMTSGGRGVPARLAQISTVYKKAEAEMEKLTGESRRLPRVIDLPSFLDVYGSVGLP